MKIDNEKILSALMSAGSIREAAKIAHISESTIRSRLNDPEFKREYQKAKDKMLIEVCDTLTARLSGAIDTLYNIMNDTEIPATVRLSAADSIMRHGLRYNETGNIIRRIEAIEKLQNDN